MVQPRTPFPSRAWRTALPADDNSNMLAVAEIDGVPTEIFPIADKLGVIVLDGNAELYARAGNFVEVIACLRSPLTYTTVTFLRYPLSFIFFFQTGEHCGLCVRQVALPPVTRQTGVLCLQGCKTKPCRRCRHPLTQLPCFLRVSHTATTRKKRYGANEGPGF